MGRVAHLCTDTQQGSERPTFLFLQNLLACFHSGSDSFAGDACEVKVAAPSHSPAAEAEYWRIKAMAQQVRTDDGIRTVLNQSQRP